MAPKRCGAKAAGAPKAAAKAVASSGSASSSSRSVSSSSGALAELAQASGNKAIQVTQDIDTLIQQQKDMRAHRRKVAQDLKNAKKKKGRLQKRARLLTTEDLLTVVALREKDNFNVAEMFGASQSTEEGPEEGSGSADEAQLQDAAPGERDRSPVSNTGAAPPS
jgi:hypothetical protein